MTWIWAALMPHPPILAPEVGRGRESAAAATLAGLGRLTATLASRPERRPETLVLLSPHQPYVEGALFVNTAARLRGDLGRFGAPGLKFDLETSPALPGLLERLQAAGTPLAAGEAGNLTPDHGSLMPLYFLARAFGGLPPVIAANPIGLAPAQALALGRALASFSEPGAAWALLASGDLSHRLTREAPSGYNPEGARFDGDVTEALKSGEAEGLLAKWPAARLQEAGECGFRSVLALLGLVGGPVEMLSYEGPFGVGYCNALWLGSSGRPAEAQQFLETL
jgi:aromatic ring-opening dioxygenase LigB subunit